MIICRECAHFRDTSGTICGPCVAIPGKPNFSPREKKLLILGYARHGKDTVAELLRDHHGVSFQSSSHFLADVCVRPYLAAQGITYDTLEDCYADRGNHRADWHHAIVAYNDDPTRLTRAILEVSNAYVGMRSARELAATRSLFDAIFWVDSSKRGLPPEPKSSMDIVYDPDIMVLIENSGTLDDLKDRVDEAFRGLSCPI